MYFLVTGAAGFIGSHLVDALLVAGHRVDGVDDLSTGSSRNLPDGFQLAEMKDRERGWLGAEWDAIFHCSAMARIQPSFRKPVDTVHNNVAGTLNMLEHARRHGSRFIYAGSSTCDGDIYANPYALSKHLGEDLCHLYAKVYKLPCAIARFYNVYGPRQIEEGPYATAMGIWEKAYREGQPLPMCGDGSKRRDWTHVEDIVSGMIAIDERLEKTNRPRMFHLGTGSNASVAEVLAMFCGEIDCQPDRPGEAQDTLAKTTRARHYLNWKPKWRIADYIEQVKEEQCRLQKHSA